MALTLAGLAADRPLGLRVLTGDDVLDRPIGWVHPTELTDPQAFLEGGELLLTTGLALDEETSPAYVRRLVDAGVAGLGFGVGLSHDVVPRSLVATAAVVGLPVLEVPRETPFIAITRAVSRAVAADEYATTVRIGRAQQELTRTAVGQGGPAGVLRKLAKLVDGWVLLFDRTTVAEAAPASARAYGASLREELERLRAGTRVVALDGQEVVLQTLDTSARRVLAVGPRPARHGGAAHRQHRGLGAFPGAGTGSRAGGGPAGTAVRVAGAAGGRPGRAGVAGAGRRRARAAGAAVVGAGVPRCARRRGASCSERWTEERVRGAARGRRWSPSARRRRRPVAEAALRIGGLHGGLAGPVPHGLRGRAGAGGAGRPRGGGGGQDPGLGGRAHGPRPAVAHRPGGGARLRRHLLAPLRAHDETGRGDLVESLRCWLEHHGHWDVAAARLGVHRHTLRNRIRKAQELLGRDLDSPGVRAELWVALQA